MATSGVTEIMRRGYHDYAPNLWAFSLTPADFLAPAPHFYRARPHKEIKQGPWTGVREIESSAAADYT